MSIEDNIQEPAANVASNETNSFFTKLKSWYNSFTDTIWNQLNIATKPLQSIVKVVDFGIDMIKWWQDREQALDKVDNFIWWYGSQIKRIFDKDTKLDLDEKEFKNLEEIKWFQNRLTKNPFETLWVTDFLWMKSSIQTLDVDSQKELNSKLESLNIELPDDLKKEQTDLYNRFNKTLKAKVEKVVREEIQNNIITNNVDVVAKRMEELWKQYSFEVEKDFQAELEALNNKIKPYFDTSEETVYSQYITPVDWKTAKETYLEWISSNSAIRTRQYIEKEVVQPILDATFPKEYLELYTAQWTQDTTIDNMMTQFKEKLMRDYTYKYELLANEEDPKEIAKLNAMITPQIEARKKFFTEIINNYTTSVNKYEWKADDLNNKNLIFKDDKDELIDNAYRNAFESLSEEDKKALLVRDWTDTIVDIYTNAKSAWKIFEKMNQKDFKWTMLSAWDAAETVFWVVWWIAWAWVSAAASSSFKYDDFKKVYFDEYELATANDNFPQKMMKHIFYNVDDIWELMIPVAVWNKIDKGSKVIDKWIRSLRAWSEAASKWWELWLQSKKLQYVKEWWAFALKLPLYWARWVTSWVVANQVADRMMRQAETEANTYVTLVSDIFMEPIMRAWWKAFWSKWWYEEWIYKNPIAQNIQSFMMWEKSLTPAAKDLMKEFNATLKEWETALDLPTAMDTIRQWRDLYYWVENKTVDDVFNKQDLNVFYNTIKENIDRLQKNNTEAWANKMFTTSGWILKIEDLVTKKNESSNRIVDVFEMAAKWNNVEKLIWNMATEKLYNDVEKVITWKLEFDWAHLNIPKEKIDWILNTFNTKIESIKKTEDIEVRKQAMVQMYSKLYDLRNQYVSDFNKITPMISLHSPLLGQSIKIKLDDVESSLWMTYDQLLSTKTITIDDALSTKSWLKAWQYRFWKWDKTILNKIKGDKKIFNELEKLLTSWKDRIWYTIQLNKEQLDLFKEEIKIVFWDSLLILDQLKWITKWRDQISEIMMNTDSNLVLSYWTLPKKEDVFQVYLWLWSKLIKKWFKIHDVTSYHQKSAEIILDILSAENIEKWIEFARPINNIESEVQFTQAYKQKFIWDLLVEKWYATVSETWKYIRSDKWTEIAEFLSATFKWDENDDQISRYIFEVVSTRIVNNYDILSNILKDINEFNARIKAWEEPLNIIWWVLKTKQDLEALMWAFSWDKTISRLMDKTFDSFEHKEFRKIWSRKYKALSDKQKIQINNLKAQKEELLEKLSLWSQTKMIEAQIKFIDDEIERISKVLAWVKKQDYINAYSKWIFSQSFNKLFTKQLTWVLKLIEWIDPKKLQSIEETTSIKKEIVKAKTKIKEAKDEIVKIKKESTEKLTKEQIDKYKWIIDSNKKHIKKYEEKKIKLQTELNAIQEIISSKELSTKADLIKNELKKSNGTIQQVFDIAYKYKDDFSKSEALLNIFISELSQKTRFSDWKPFSPDVINFIREEELKKAIIRLINWEIDYEIEKKESSLLKMFQTALTWSKNDQMIKWDIVFNHILDKYKIEDFNKDKSLKEIIDLENKLNNLKANEIFEDIDIIKFEIKDEDITYNLRNKKEKVIIKTDIWDQEVEWNIIKVKWINRDLTLIKQSSWNYSVTDKLSWLNLFTTSKENIWWSFRNYFQFDKKRKWWESLHDYFWITPTRSTIQKRVYIDNSIQIKELENKIEKIKDFIKSKEINNLQQLYFSEAKDNSWDTFRKTIDWFLSTKKDIRNKTDWTWMYNNSFNNFKRYIDDILEELVNQDTDKLWLILVSKDWTKYMWNTALSLMKDNPQFYSSLFKKMKALSNLTNNWTLIKLDEDWNVMIKENQIIENVILTKQVTDYFNTKDKWFRILSVSKIDTLWKLKLNWTNISTWLNKKLSKKRETIYDYTVSSDSLKVVRDIINNRSKWYEELMLQLKLDKDEYIMWTYWDKESHIQIYKTDTIFKDIEELHTEFTELYANAWNFKLKWKKIFNEDIAKRETAMVSNKKEFENYDEEVNVYVLDKMPFNWAEDIIERIKWFDEDAFNKQRLDIINTIKEKDPTFDLDISNYKKEDLISYLETWYLSDTKDWWAWMSNLLAKIHDLISTWTTKTKWVEKDKAKKFHLVHTTKDWETFLWKALFNRLDIRVYDEVSKSFKQSDNTVVMTKSSAKLKWWYTEFAKSNQKTIEINWIKYKIVWEVKWVKTSAFRNAASDSYKVKDEQSISEQLINLMHYSNKNDYVKIMQKKIDEVYKKYIWDIWNAIELPTFWEANIFLNQLNKTFNVWWLSDSVISARVKWFIDEIKELLKWSKSVWASHEINSAMIELPEWLSFKDWTKHLKRNEVFLSKKSDIVQTTISNLNIRKEELELKWIDILSQWEKNELNLILDQLENWIYLSAFRNPLPNKENMWLYRAKYFEEVTWPWRSKITFWHSHDVIFHPETIFLKLQADFDGDHAVLVPINTAEGRIIAKDILWLKSQDSLASRLVDDQWQAISFKNDVAIIKQVEDAERVEKSLMFHRDKNLEAKVTVWVWSSTIRTFNILKQLMEEYRETSDNNRKLEILNYPMFPTKWKSPTLKEIFDTTLEIQNYWVTDQSKILTIDNLFDFDNTYWWLVWSILQLVLDYAKDKTWKAFDRQKWLKELFATTWLTNDTAVQYLYNKIISPIWMTHKSATEDLSSTLLYKYLPKAKEWYNKYIVESSMWYRRELWKYLYDRWYLRQAQDLKWTTELEFYFKNIFDVDSFIKEYNVSPEDTIQLKEILLLNRLENNERVILNNIVSKVTDNKLLNDFKELTKEDWWAIDYQKRLKELWAIDSKWELKISTTDRDLISLYSLWQWNKTIYTLLSDSDRINLLNFSTNLRLTKRFKKEWWTSYFDSLFKVNPELRPTIILNSFTSKESVKDQLDILDTKIEQANTRIERLTNKIDFEQDEINESLSRYDDETFKEIDMEDEVKLTWIKNETPNQLDETIELDKEDLDAILEEKNNLEETKKFMQEQLTALTDVKLLSDKKVKYIDTVREVKEEELEVPYVNNLDITYKLWDKEISELKVNIKRALNFEKLLSEWMKLTLEWYLSAANSDVMQKLYTMREIGWNLWITAKKLLLKMDSDFMKDMRVLWVTKTEVQTMIDKTKWIMIQWVSWTNENWFADFKFDLDNFKLKAIDEKHESETWLLNYWTDPKIKERHAEYVNKFTNELAIPLVEKLQKTNEFYKDVWWYSVNYKSSWTTFFDDLLWAFNWDLEFEFRRRWIFTKAHDKEKAFVNFLRDSSKWKLQDWKEFMFEEKKAKILYKSIFDKKDEWWLIRFAKNMQGWNYFWSYQLGSVILGWAGHMAWATQVLWNTLELLAFWQVLWNKHEDASNLLQHFKLEWEDLLSWWQGKDRADLETSWAWQAQQFASTKIKSAIEKALWFAIKDPILLNRIANIIDTTITEPLFATDLLQDELRKRVAMMATMKDLWYTNIEQFKRDFTTSTDIDRIKTLFYARHSELWGWVISTFPVLRETFITAYEADAYMTTKVFKTLYKYLMWWSIHKTVWFADKMYWLWRWMWMLHSNPKHWELLIKEWLDFLTAQIINMWLAVWIWMKTLKYDYTDEDDRVSLKSFVENSTNMWVALEILFSREIENIKWVKWSSFETDMAVTWLEFFKHITRIFNANPIKLYKDIENRMTSLDEWFPTALYWALRSEFSSYMRWAYWTQIQNMFYGNETSSNLWLYYWQETVDELASRDFQNSNAAAKMSTLWFNTSIAELLTNYLSATYIWNEMMYRWYNELIDDKEIRKIYEEWFQSKNWYDLRNLMFDENWFNKKMTSELWKQLVSYQAIGDDFDSLWYKDTSWLTELYNTKFDDIITNQLLAMWLTKEDFISWPLDRTEWKQKLFYEVSQWNIPELSTKHLVSYIIYNKYSSEKYKIEKWVADNYNLPFWKKYKLSDVEEAQLQWQVLNQAAKDWLLDINKENHQIVLWLHVWKNHAELVEDLNKSWAYNQLKWYMDALIVSNHNLKEWDTNAKFLISKYRKWLESQLNYYRWNKPVKPTAEAVEIMTNATMTYISEIQNSTQDQKTKIAKTAAALTWLNKEAWDLYKNDRTFNMLTLPAQKQLISWLYKTNKELTDYDANSITNYPMDSTFTSSKKWKYTPNYFRKNQSSPYWSWARPWFSEQFPEMWEYLQGKKVPQNFERIAQMWLPQKNMNYRWLQFQAVDSMRQYAFKQIYSEITRSTTNPKISTNTARWKVRTWYLKTTKKNVWAAYKKLKVPKQYPTVRKGTISTLPWAIDVII